MALNLVQVEAIERKSLEEYPEEYTEVTEGYLKLLSVGRLEVQKGYDLTINVCKKLVESGYKFKWFILGKALNVRQLRHKLKNRDWMIFFVQLVFE